jgi:hypothetical protein
MTDTLLDIMVQQGRRDVDMLEGFYIDAGFGEDLPGKLLHDSQEGHLH